MENETSVLSTLFTPHISLDAVEHNYLNNIPVATRSFAARRKLVHDGQRCDHVFVVQSGWLAGYKQLPDGGRQIFNFWLPGEFVGLDFLTYDWAPYAVMSLTPSQIGCVGLPAMKQMERDLPRVASFLMGLMSRHNVILRQRMVSLGRRTAFSRVAHLLLELCARAGADLSVPRVTTPFPLTQLEIADCLGLTAPYVNRILRQMRERDLVQLGNDRLEVRDVRRLAALAEFCPSYLQPHVEGKSTFERPPRAAMPPAAVAGASVVPLALSENAGS
jgi:CRP-like cAMP-binding protein